MGKRSIEREKIGQWADKANLIVATTHTLSGRRPVDKTERRWLLIVLLAVGVSLLALLAFWPSPKEGKRPLLVDYEPRRVVGAAVRYGEREMRFKRLHGRWWMVSPYSLPASRANLERLLELPLAEPQGSYPTSKTDLTELGLDPPKATVRLDGVEIRFGRQHPLKLLRYVQLNRLGQAGHLEEQVFLIEDSLFFLLSSPPTFWLDHRLVPDGRIQGLKLPERSVYRNRKGGWRSDPPLADEALRKLVEAWQNAHAVEISPFKGEVPETAEIVVTTDQGKIRFRLLSLEPELVLLREELKLRYHLLPEMAKTLGLFQEGERSSPKGKARP